MIIIIAMMMPQGRWNVLHHAFDQFLSTHALICRAKRVSGKQDPHDHARELEGTDSGFLQDAPLELAIDGCRNQRTKNTHGGGFRWRGNATDNGAKHHDHNANGQQHGS